MSPFPRSKTGYIYVLIVFFIKWIECSALRVANGRQIKEVLEEIISRWGIPRFLLTDNGTEFVNQTLRAFANEHGIMHTTVPPYHPQINPIEWVNRVLKTMIVAFLEQDHRD
ncbi:Gypsy retrotransposon integrase-like protein 1 [Camponotus japonicus]